MKKLRRPKGPKGGMNQIMKQMQKMQADMEKAQGEAADIVAEGNAGDRAVVAKINGKNELISITLDKEVVDPDDIETLEDLIIVAVNSAQKNVSAQVEERMSQVTGGMSDMMGGRAGFPFGG